MDVRIGFDGSGREPHPDFQRRLKEFNRSQGTPRVVVRWHPRAQLVSFKRFARDKRGRKGIVYDGVYVPAWEIGVVLDGLPPGYDTVGEHLPNGERFVKICDWVEDLDDSVFDYLRTADTARRGPDPLERLEAQEKLKEAETLKQARALGAAKGQYYYHWNNPTVSMNPDTKVKADWRHGAP